MGTPDVMNAFRITFLVSLVMLFAIFFQVLIAAGLDQLGRWIRERHHGK